MGTYEVKWKVDSVTFKLTLHSENPSVMSLPRENGLPQFLTTAEAYLLAKQIEKNFRHAGMNALKKVK